MSEEAAAAAAAAAAPDKNQAAPPTKSRRGIECTPLNHRNIPLMPDFGAKCGFYGSADPHSGKQRNANPQFQAHTCGFADLRHTTKAQITYFWSLRAVYGS